MYTLNVSLCVNELVFPFVLLVLVYHGYTNADIGPCWVGTELNIYTTYKQTNSKSKELLLNTGKNNNNANVQKYNLLLFFYFYFLKHTK